MLQPSAVGVPMSPVSAQLASFGYMSQVCTPVLTMTAVHIANDTIIANTGRLHRAFWLQLWLQHHLLLLRTTEQLWCVNPACISESTETNKHTLLSLQGTLTVCFPPTPVGLS